MDITHAGRIYFFVFILFEKFLLVFCGMTVMCPCKVPLLIYSMIISSYRYEMLHFSTLKFRIKPSWNNMDISVCTRPSYWHGPRKEESRFPKSTGNAPDTPKPPIIPNSNLKTTVHTFFNNELIKWSRHQSRHQRCPRPLHPQGPLTSEYGFMVPPI